MFIPFNKLLLSKIKGIIHLGAHEAQELDDYIKQKITNIIWVEANPNKYELLEKKIKPYKDMRLAKFAAGSKKNKAYLNIANHDQSTSFYEFGVQLNYFQDLKVSSRAQVDILPIDDYIKNNVKIPSNYNFIYLDIEGHELEALKGMKNHLRKVDYVYSEVHFVEFNKGCPLIKDLDDFLRAYNFFRVGTFNTKKGWGDAIYSKKNIFFSRIYYFLILFKVNLKQSEIYYLLLKIRDYTRNLFY